MRTLFTGAIAALAMGSVLMISNATSPASAADGMAVIEKRINLMKNDVLGPWKVITAFAKEDKGTVADVAKAATELGAAAGQIAGLFPKGTGRGDFDDKVTRALPKIWEDWAGFEKAAGVLVAEAATLAKTAAGGDTAAIKAQIGATGKNGCGGCHTPFRGEKVK